MTVKSSKAFKHETLKSRPDFDNLSNDVFLRREQVIYYGIYNKGRSSLWRDIKENRFPAPIKHGLICLWQVGNLREWLKSLALSGFETGGLK